MVDVIYDETAMKQRCQSTNRWRTILEDNGVDGLAVGEMLGAICMGGGGCFSGFAIF